MGWIKFKINQAPYEMNLEDAGRQIQNAEPLNQDETSSFIPSNMGWMCAGCMGCWACGFMTKFSTEGKKSWEKHVYSFFSKLAVADTAKYTPISPSSLLVKNPVLFRIPMRQLITLPQFPLARLVLINETKSDFLLHEKKPLTCSSHYLSGVLLLLTKQDPIWFIGQLLTRCFH